jgi:hypothetical protein
MFFSKEKKFQRLVIRKLESCHSNRYNENINYLTLKLLSFATFSPRKNIAKLPLLVENFSYLLFKIHNHLDFTDNLDTLDRFMLKKFIKTKICTYAVYTISDYWGINAEKVQLMIEQRIDFYLRKFDPPTYYDFDVVSFNIYKSLTSEDLNDFTIPDLLELGEFDEIHRIMYGMPYLQTLDGLIGPELLFAKLAFSLDRLDEKTRLEMLKKLNTTL